MVCELEKLILHELDLCGCTEISEVVPVIINILSWCGRDIENRLSYKTLFNNEGIYYLVMSLLDNEGLIEHGTSIRHPFLTEKGQKLLNELERLAARIER